MPNGNLYKSTSKHLIIICNGLGDSYHLPVYQQIINKLQKLGYSVYAFDYSNNLSPYDLQAQVQTIKEVIKHFSQYSHITLLGGSFGALAAAITASQIRIANLITVNGFFGYPNLKLILSIRYLLFRYLPKYSKLFQYLSSNYQPQNITMPTLVIHGKSDKIVLPIQSQKFYQTLTCPKQLQLIENMDHSLTFPNNVTNLCSYIHIWLKSQKV